MRVFVAHGVDGFEWIMPVEEHDFQSVYELDGSSMVASWRPVRVRALDRLHDGGPILRQADLPWLGEHALVLRSSAYRAIGPALADVGEFLALDLVGSEDRLRLFNVRRTIDALDEGSSDIVRFPSTGRVMKIRRHEFREEALTGEGAFRVPEVRTLFFTEKIVRAVDAAGLSGTEFDMVWEGLSR
ncbi:MAG: hypothetical protein KJ698_08695 [Actinobacteria bacterium]|nr:hypothetical protein [Actinomycetota bacterium]